MKLNHHLREILASLLPKSPSFDSNHRRYYPSERHSFQSVFNFHIFYIIIDREICTCTMVFLCLIIQIKSWNFSILIFSIIQYLQNKSQKLSRVCWYILGWSHLEINKTIYHQNTFLLYPGNHCNEKLKSIWKSSKFLPYFAIIIFHIIDGAAFWNVKLYNLHTCNLYYTTTKPCHMLELDNNGTYKIWIKVFQI